MNNFKHLIQNLFSKKTLALSYSLAKVNFKLRNEGSYLGILWYLLSPLSLFITILFVKQTAFNHAYIPFYPLYLLVGLVMLSYLNRVVHFTTDTIRNNGNFIKSINVPAEVLVISSVLHVCMLHVFEIFLIICLALYLHIPIVHIGLYMLATFAFTLFLLGLAFLFSTIGVYVTDIGNIWSVFSQLLFFLTPIFYTVDQTSGLYLFNMYNPFYYFITLSRDILISGATSASTLQIALILSATSVFFGIVVFSQYKRRFAEWI